MTGWAQRALAGMTHSATFGPAPLHDDRSKLERGSPSQLMDQA